MRNTYLVCYDVSDDRRRTRVAKAMMGFGDRIQYSVFECQFTKTDLLRCRHALSGLIHHTEDQALFVLLGPSEGRGDRVITAIGRPYSRIDAPCLIVE
jgi:CRISPR-associated protein Cas2